MNIPDCKHSPNGVCSKCVLFRSFNLNSSSSETTVVEKKEDLVATPSTSKSSVTIMSLDAPLTASLAVAGQFRFLPVSNIEPASTSRPSSAEKNSRPLAIDPAALSMPSPSDDRHHRRSSSASSCSTTTSSTPDHPEATTYTSFEEMGIRHEAKVHQTDVLRSISTSSSSPASSSSSSPKATPERTVSVPRAPSLLLRLFESDLCDISMTLQYLHSAKERGVVSYLGNKLFKLPHTDVDIYIPQLVNLLLTKPDVAESIKPYLVSRCKSSAQFALDCSWLLEAYNHDRTTGVLTKGFTSEGESFRQLILADFRVEQAEARMAARGRKSSFSGGHARSNSDATMSSMASSSELSAVPASMRRVESSLSTLRYLAPGTLPHGRAFDNGCECFDGEDEEKEVRECDCGADRLRAEQDFIRALTGIGDRLRLARNKKEKSHRLISELHLLNAHLPARVWIPLYETTPHIVLRIPPEGGCVLNSKDKAPYCVYVEVLQCEDPSRVKVPPRLSESEAELHERLGALARGSPPSGATVDGERGGASCHDDASTSDGQSIPVIECKDAQGADQRWWPDDRGVVTGEDSLSQRSMDSWNSHEERTISPADIRRRLKEWVKKPRRQMRHTPDDPSAHAMSEPWDEKRERLRLASPYGRLPGWQLLPVIVKTGDDLRQELLAYQLLKTLDSIWRDEGVPLLLRPYKILVLSHDSGMLEPIVNACSLHQIKRNLSAVYMEEGKADTPSLLGHFVECFGPVHSDAFMDAQTNLVRSTAAYSLACYFLQVKDRHNGNILIDAEGRLIHIDFGFILSASPRNLGFETSPFKLTTELVDVMGGTDSEMFQFYKLLMLQGLLAARKHLDRIMNIVEIMIHGSPLACFRGGAACLKAMRDRFHLTTTEPQLKLLVEQMVEASRDSLTTRLYDNYQYYSNGIL